MDRLSHGQKATLDGWVEGGGVVSMSGAYIISRTPLRSAFLGRAVRGLAITGWNAHPNVTRMSLDEVRAHRGVARLLICGALISETPVLWMPLGGIVNLRVPQLITREDDNDDAVRIEYEGHPDSWVWSLAYTLTFEERR